MSNTTLALGSYTIQVGSDWSALRDLLAQRQYSAMAVLVDENTERDCLPLLLNELEKAPDLIIRVPAGEVHKTIQSCQSIWQQMITAKLDRRAVLLNLGGGVIGDMGGFCAATYKRGIDFIQIPTTLLAQVDASIGSKLGIDFADIKNSIGLFRDPQLVMIDPSFLKTLARAELISGMAEMIKHALIEDVEQWPSLCDIQDIRDTDWTVLIPPSLRVKQRIVEADPFERGIRKALNFGHTIGHALESWALPTEAPLLHGEAIAWGMVAEAYLSVQQGRLSQAALIDIQVLVKRWYPKPALSATDFPVLIDYIRNDKKNEGGAILFTLLEGIGKCSVNVAVEEVAIRKALEYLVDIFK